MQVPALMNFSLVGGIIQNIKVDIVKHPHPLLNNPEIENGIRLYHTVDIAAMKVNAILGRGKIRIFGIWQN